MAEPSDPNEAPFLEVDEEDAKPPLKPIYTALARRTTTSVGNLTCSGSKEFCFLCQYTSTEDADVDLRQHVCELTQQGQEVSTIANAVFTIYEREIRPTLVHENADGTVIHAPKWSIESIRRHLLLSPEYEADVFENYTRFLFKSVILRQADRIVNPESGEVDPETTKSLLNTLKQYSDYKAKGPPAKRARRSQNETPA